MLHRSAYSKRFRADNNFVSKGSSSGRRLLYALTGKSALAMRRDFDNLLRGYQPPHSDGFYEGDGAYNPPPLGLVNSFFYI